MTYPSCTLITKFAHFLKKKFNQLKADSLSNKLWMMFINQKANKNQAHGVSLHAIVPTYWE